MVNKMKGFTLIELMIVVVIIAVLASIAYPAYQEYVRKTNRTDAQTEVMDIAHRLQRYKVANFSFIKADGTAVTLADVNHSGVVPTSGTPFYDLALSNVAPGTWTLTATPKASSRQTGNGHFVINHRGERCWTKGTDTSGTACVPTATSNWDGR
jgi:type IV pilus assembly protein PilE